MHIILRRVNCDYSFMKSKFAAEVKQVENFVYANLYINNLSLFVKAFYTTIYYFH